MADLTVSSNVDTLLSAANYAAIRALLDLEVGTDLQAWSSVLDATTASFLSADRTKLDGIEASADVTDAANVTSAGALMDSECNNLPALKDLNQFVSNQSDVDFGSLVLQGTLQVGDGTSIGYGGTSKRLLDSGGIFVVTADWSAMHVKCGLECSSLIVGGTGGPIVKDATNIVSFRNGADTADLPGRMSELQIGSTNTDPAITDNSGTVEIKDIQGSNFKALKALSFEGDLSSATGRLADTGLAVSDESTALTASTSVPLATLHAQRAVTLTEVLIGVTTAPTGSTLTGDLHLNGTTIFSTKPTIDAGEKTSVTAATAAVLSTTAVAQGDLLEFFCDAVGATIAGAGLKFYINQKD